MSFLDGNMLLIKLNHVNFCYFSSRGSYPDTQPLMICCISRLWASGRPRSAGTWSPGFILVTLLCFGLDSLLWTRSHVGASFHPRLSRSPSARLILSHFAFACCWWRSFNIDSAWSCTRFWRPLLPAAAFQDIAGSTCRSLLSTPLAKEIQISWSCFRLQICVA